MCSVVYTLYASIHRITLYTIFIYENFSTKIFLLKFVDENL
jgi:hypothetical protein